VELLGIGVAPSKGMVRGTVNDTEALVVTTDFFPPIVDDPYMFGRIAAANALSDVYAMGGRPLVALNLVCVPPKTLPPESFRQMLLGGHDAVSEAGAVIAGGHTIKDSELKYGLAVTGIVNIADLKTNATARPGDKLILTKPLGTGIIATGVKNNKVNLELEDILVQQMARLNRVPAEIAAEYRCSAITDVTGFGLIGHSLEMAEGSGVGIVLNAASVPRLPSALELAAAGLLTGGGKDNINFYRDRVRYHAQLDEPMIQLLHDPQTSGGLLIAVHPEDAESMQLELLNICAGCAIVGEVSVGEAVITVQ
jgi:selenide,water dikinase